jgi:hypothetical protein
MSAALIIGGMGVFSFRQPTVAACWDGRYIPFLRALLVRVTVPAPQAVWRLLALCSDVAKLQAVMALRKTILSSICLYPDCDVAEAWQWLGSWKISWDFTVLEKVIRKRGGYNEK